MTGLDRRLSYCDATFYFNTPLLLMIVLVVWRTSPVLTISYRVLCPQFYLFYTAPTHVGEHTGNVSVSYLMRKCIGNALSAGIRQVLRGELQGIGLPPLVTIDVDNTSELAQFKYLVQKCQP